MELLKSIALLLVIFVAWLYLAKFINDNYQRSRGWSALFWVILLFGTLSFLFGSSGNSNPSSGGGDNDYYDDDDCHKNPWESDDSSSSFNGDDE